MQVNKTEEAVHIDKMISLSQARPLYPADGDKPAMAGSTWSHDYDMPYLEKGIEEGKKEYKARLKAQKDEMSKKLLDDEHVALLTEYQKEDFAAYKEWEDRVMGRVKVKK